MTRSISSPASCSSSLPSKSAVNPVGISFLSHAYGFPAQRAGTLRACSAPYPGAHGPFSALGERRLGGTRGWGSDGGCGSRHRQVMSQAPRPPFASICQSVAQRSLAPTILTTRRVVILSNRSRKTDTGTPCNRGVLLAVQCSPGE